MLRSLSKNCLQRQGAVRNNLKFQVIRRLTCVQIKKQHIIKENQCKSLLFPKTKSQPVWSFNFVRNYSSLPAHSRITLPALSPTMELGTIVSWEKKEGDKLNEGDLLAEIETDKATMGFETPEEGYLAKILIAAGSRDVPIGKLVCIIVENEEDVAAFKDFQDDGVPATQKPTQATPSTPASVASQSTPQRELQTSSLAAPLTAVEQKFGDRVFASPMAKKLAEQQKLRLEGRGSGILGSLTSKDLGKLDAAAQPTLSSSAGIPTGAAFVDLPVSGIREVIAKRLLESKTQIPHYYLTVDVNMDEILKLRTQLNKKLEK